MRIIQACLFFLLLLGITVSAKAQIDYDYFPKASTNYFIENVFIYQGKVSATPTHILIKDGKIADIGPNIKRPKSAILIEADCMYVYPAFIDVLNLSILKKGDEKKEKVDVKFPGMPPDEVAGITPDRSAEATVKDSKIDISKSRADGFSIVQIGHENGMLPGSTFIAALHDDVAKSTITNKKNQVAQFQGAQGVYPNTTIAVMAKFRDLYRNAEIFGANQAKYTSQQNIGIVPDAQKSIKALVPITKKQEMVYFVSPGKLDAMKVINLKNELGFNAILTDIGDINGLEKEILSSGLPIALNMKLPKERKNEEAKDSIITEETKELAAIEARAMASYTSRVAQAARLDSLNINFAFSSGKEGTADIHDNLVKMVKA